MPLILPGNVGSATAATTYSIDNSCRFNDDDTPKLSRDFGSDGSLVACTINVWAKLGAPPTGTKNILWTYVSGTNANLKFGGESGLGEIHFYSNRTGESPAEPELLTNTFHRDVSAWYNIHAVWDSANGTEGDRMRLYLNGTRLTDFHATTAYPQSNGDFGLFNYSDGARTINVSNKPYGGANHFDGYLANIIVCDGQTYEPTKFGEFDEDSPTIWKPIDPSAQSLNFGTHGFWLDFKDSSALGNDVSGNDNDMTPANLAAVDQCSDSPTNNYAVLNPLENYFPAATFSEGNTQIVLTDAPRTFCTATIGLTAGKWYWEQKFVTHNTGDHANLGVASKFPVDAGANLGEYDYTYSYDADGGKTTNNSSSSYGDSFTANDIISVALDLDNLKIYYAKNGTWQNSGDPTTGATGTGAAFTLTAVASTTSGAYFPAIGKSSTGVDTWQINFGNPAYTNSSDAADADGYGAFEYAPPSGYFAICTKNLAEYGG